MRKQTLVYFDTDKLQLLDQYLKMPCSRSDLLNDIVGFVLKTPYVIESFVTSRNDEMRIKAESNITQ